MSERMPHLLINDILASAEKIIRYTADISFEDFSGNDQIVDAVIRNFEIIGEAANRLPEAFKDVHTEIDWHRIRGFRNRIVHDYAGIDLQIVWNIKETFLPDMMKQLQSL